MGKRFNNLEDVYNTLLAANFNFDSLPSTNKFRKYKQWKQDPELRELPATSVRNTGRRLTVVIQPFGLVFADDKKVSTGISGDAGPIVASNGGTSLYNHLVGGAGGTPSLPNFLPAKAIIGLRLVTARSVPATSNRITGRAYKTRTGRTHTIPFGAGVATDREFDVQDQIIADRTATHSVTFTPERLYRR